MSRQDDSKKEMDSTDYVTLVAKKCFSEGIINDWEIFMNNHDSEFVGVTNGEHSHIHYDIYERYFRLVEGAIETACEEIGISSLDFHLYCKENQNSPIVDVFCTLISISTTFEAFSDIMTDMAKRSYMFQIIHSWRKTLFATHRK